MFNAEKETKIVKNFDDLNKDAKKLKDESVAYIKSNSSDSINSAKDRAREAGKKISEFFQNNSKKLKTAEETTARTIRSNPLTSAAVIFVTGWIIGSALKRSRKV